VTYNLLLWKWSKDYEIPSKRKHVKFSDISRSFVENGSHVAMGKADLEGFLAALSDAFGADPESRPFVVEQYDLCVVINYPNSMRGALVPKVAGIGQRFGLNASEF
jgi:hypothetical protein